MVEDGGAGSWAPWPENTEALIDAIEERFHAAHRRELPELIRLAQAAEAEGSVQAGLAGFLQRVAWDLESHLMKEEQGLFPAMRAGEAPSGAAFEVMRDEHDAHGETLARLRAMTGDFRVPEAAAGTVRALYAGLAKLARDLEEHIRVENDLLFPRFGG